MTAGSIRDLARHAAISGLAPLESLLGRISDAANRHRIQFLYLHHVFQHEEQSFRRLLTDLMREYRFLAYGKAVERITAGDIDDSYIAVSFDDGFACNVQAATIMSDLGISGCFFLATSIIGVKEPRALAEFCRTNLKSEPVDFMGWDDVERLIRDGHEIGGHTRAHPDLATVSEDVVEDEIGGCFEDLQRRTGSVRHFAWPFGHFSNFSPLAARTVFTSGFRSCASAVRGCHVPSGPASVESICLRRDHVDPKWPTSHIRYFVQRNSRRATAKDNGWPASLDPGMLTRANDAFQE
jgi:peptidoglycan/xylan/chitin deacetylase (PgdA/CDA1 family)